MKNLSLIILLLVSNISIGQQFEFISPSYETQELAINLGEIDRVEILLEMEVEPDGVYQYFQIPPVSTTKSVINLLLIDYQPYYIRYWEKGSKYPITFLIQTNGGDIIDDRDLDIIGFKGDYVFKKGVLVFNYHGSANL